jgi:hypothetical protein
MSNLAQSSSGISVFSGPIVSALANKFGCRIVTIIGSIIAAAFFVLSSFSTSIKMMMATYGVMGGLSTIQFFFYYCSCNFYLLT